MKALLRITLVTLLLSATAIYAASIGAESSRLAADAVLRALLMSVLPLASLVATWDLTREGSVALARHGANRRHALAREWGRRAGVLVGCITVACVAGLVWTRTIHDPLLAIDVLHTVPVALAATVSLMALAMSARLWAGKVGLVLTMLCAVLLGGSEAVVAALVPGGHVLHLLGTGDPLPLPQLFSMLILYAMACLFGVLAAVRVPR